MSSSSAPSSRSSIARTPTTVSATSMVVGRPGRRRENARSCDVRSAARRAARWTSSTACTLVSPCTSRARTSGVAGDHRHEVVEVVCDAAREAPERLEALGLAELLRQSLGLGHVADDRAVARSPCSPDREAETVCLVPSAAATPARDPRSLAARDALLDRSSAPPSQAAGPRRAAAQHVRGARAERGLRRAVPREDGPVGARREDRVVRRLDDGGQVAPLLLVVPLPGHVAPDRRDPDDLPVRPPDRGEGEVDRPLRPVRRQQVRVERRGRAVQDARGAPRAARVCRPSCADR